MKKEILKINSEINFEKFIGKKIKKITWKDDSITDCSSKNYYIGIVGYEVSVCDMDSVYNEKIKLVKEIEF